MSAGRWLVDIARRLGALLVLLGLLAGVPAALWILGGAYLPDTVPTWPQVTGALTGPDSGGLFYGFLVVVGWLAWARFAVSVAVEIPAHLRGVSAPPLPGLGGSSRQLAGLLVAAVIGISAGPALASAAPAWASPGVVAEHTVAGEQTTTAGRGGDQAEAEPAPVAAPDPAGPTYTVQPRDTLGRIAANTLGDWERYDEIFALNRGIAQADGGALTEARTIRSGWVLALPADAVVGSVAAVVSPADVGAEVVVAPGDTLSEIAADLGLGSWVPIFEANRGEPQGARRFTDPDLIFPGQRLDVPAAAAAPATPVEVAVPPVAADPAQQAGTGYEGPQDLPVEPAPGPPLAAGERAGSGESAGQERAGAAQVSSDAALSVFGAGGGLLAAGAVAALVLHRRRQLRQLGPGRTVPGTPARLAAAEKRLRAAAATAGPSFGFVDVGLRSLVHGLAGDGARLPDVLGARLSEAGLDLRLAAPHEGGPPAPWTVDTSGWWWSLARDAQLPITAAQAGRYPCPYPALATVGANGEGQWLVDLERVGALHVHGPAQAGQDLARSLAAELAVNGWSDWPEVKLWGVGESVVELCPHRLSSVPEVGDGAAWLQRRLAEGLAEVTAGDPGPLESRRRGSGADAWAPMVLIAVGAAAGRELSELRRAVEQAPRAAVALVTVSSGGDPAGDGPWSCRLDEDGLLHLPALDTAVTARRLTAEQAGDIAELMRFYRDGADTPAPPAAGDRPWQAYADVGGGLLPEHTGPRHDEATAAHGEAGEALPLPAGRAAVPGSVLPQATDIYVAATASTTADVEAMGRRLPEGLRERVTDADPTLDEDLAAWADPQTDRPRLSVLGPIRLRTSGPARTGAAAKREPWLTELVAYLWSRPHGATGDELVAALWPEDAELTDEANNAQAAASLARSWLGDDPSTRQPYLSKAYRGHPYRVSGLLVDADLFARLRLRGEASGEAGLDDLTAALTLVTGRPFDQRRSAGYLWLVDNPLDHAYAKAIADVAHTVATARLAGGGPGEALVAAEVALAGGGCDDRAMLDAMQACFAEGNSTAAEQWISRIRRIYDHELDEDLPPRTFEVITRCRRRYAASSQAS